MIRMPIIGYCVGICSERRLCEEVHLNLATRGSAGSGSTACPRSFHLLEEPAWPFPRDRSRAFEMVLRRCIEEGLVGGEGLAVDASLIKADANWQNAIEGEKGLPPETTGRAVQEYLAVLDDAAFGAAAEVTSQVHLAGRSGSSHASIADRRRCARLDRSSWRAGLLRLLHQLSDRCRQRDQSAASV